MKQLELIYILQTKLCPLSLDGGGKESTHYIKQGECVICGRTPYVLAIQHGLV